MARDRRGYFRHSRRIDGVVVSEYFGAGARADVIQTLLSAERDARELRDAQRRFEEKRRWERDEPLRQLDERCNLLFQAAMLVGGYHRHKRGEWRKRTVIDKRNTLNSWLPTGGPGAFKR